MRCLLEPVSGTLTLLRRGFDCPPGRGGSAWPDSSSFFIFTPFPNWIAFPPPQFPILRAGSELDRLPATYLGSDFESL